MTPEVPAEDRGPIVHVTITGDAAVPEAILLEGEITRIGRGTENDIVLRNRFISTSHAEIVNAGGRVVLRNLRSTNGSRIRRNRWVIAVDHRCAHEAPLEDGDEILLGDEGQPVSLRVTIAFTVSPDGPSGVTIVQAVRPGELVDVARRMDREALLVLQELTNVIQPRDEPDAVARSLASWVAQHFAKVTHVTVYLRDMESEKFLAMAMQGPDDCGVPSDMSRTLQAEVLLTGQAVAFAGEVSTSLNEACIREGFCAPLVVDGSIIGLVQADRRRGGVEISLRRNEMELFAVAAKQASLALELSRLRSTFRATVEDAISNLIGVIESRDPYLAGHADAVAQLAARLAGRFRLGPTEVARIERAGALHDIGRLAVPAEILNAPGQLTPEQFARIRSVPVIGAQLIERFGFSSDLVPILRHVHERWDGKGYPDGLAGDAIPLGARIVAVADAFHTLVSHRMHQEALPQGAALREMAAAAGSRFDPRIVGALEVTIMSSDETWEFGAATSIGIEHELVAPTRK